MDMPRPDHMHLRGGRTCYGRPAALAAELARARALDAVWARVQTTLATCGRDALPVYCWSWADGTGGVFRPGDRFVYDWTLYSGAELAGRVVCVRERIRAGSSMLELDLVLPGGGYYRTTIAGHQKR